MSPEIIRTEEEGGEVKLVEVRTTRDSFDEMVHMVRDTLADSYRDVEPVIVREGKRDPMIKVGDGPKIYFHYNDGDSTISLKLAGERATDVVMSAIEGGGYEGDVDGAFQSSWESLGESSGSGVERGPTREGVPEPEDFQGGVGDEAESENGPDAYEDADFEGESYDPGSGTGEGARFEDVSGSPEGGHEGVSSFNDGSIRFTPPFDKESAEYRDNTDMEFDRAHKKCGSCAHYIEGGGCHMVQGEIDPSAYCEELYADVGVYGHKHEAGIEENLAVWGEEFDWSVEDAKEFSMDMRERIEQKIRNLMR